jgi:uncharacterized phage protein gp47/JayE
MSDQPQFLKKDHATLVRDLLRDLADPAGGRVALSDAHEGSVVRTLVEAFAHELAVAYEQIGAVYRLGYLESAEGRALDQVVALVGLARQRGGHAEGLLRFSRATPAPAAIRIPVGTLVAGRGAPEIETMADAVLDAGSRFVLVRAASVGPADAPVPARQIDQVVRPIHGIEAVTNPGEFLVTGDVETDAELRARARFSLRRGQLGTCEGIVAAARGLGVRSVRVSERQPERPGFVDVVVGDTDLDPETIAALEDAIDDARPAGIRVTLRVAEAVPVVVRVKPVLARTAVADDEARVRGELEARIRRYLESLDPDEPVVLAKLRATVLEHPEIREIAIDHTGRTELTLTTSRAGVLTNPSGDLAIEGGKRASIARIDVLLQPPVIDIWIDAVVRTRKGAPSVDELRAAVEEALRLRMDEEHAAAGQGARVLGFDALKSMLPPSLQAELKAARSTRSTTGQSVALTAGSEPMRLKAGERMTLRSVEVTGG